VGQARWWCSIKAERGFSLVETLAAFLTLVTLFSFVVPFYLTGKTFADEQIQRKQARMIAQTEVKRRLSQRTAESRSFYKDQYFITVEVKEVQLLWHISITISWENGRGEQERITLETDQFQNEGLLISK
jgi:type II secretory pathway pseudopilin PulG